MAEVENFIVAVSLQLKCDAARTINIRPKPQACFFGKCRSRAAQWLHLELNRFSVRVGGGKLSKIDINVFVKPNKTIFQKVGF